MRKRKPIRLLDSDLLRDKDDPFIKNYLEQRALFTVHKPLQPFSENPDD